MSTRTSPPQNSFSSGELSPLLHQRHDYQRFQTGLAICRGFLPLRQGGFTRAPGTVFRGNTLNNQSGRMVDFEFAVNDAVRLEFTPLKMRVWRYGSLVLSGGVPFELDTPYDAASIARLQWKQSADVIYFADGQRPIQKLSRFALDNWTIEDFSPVSGPFRTTNSDEALTIQASAATGSVTLTASAPLFQADHVGSLMMVDAVSWSNVPLWTGNTATAPGHLYRRDGRVYRVHSGTDTGVNPPSHLEGVAQTQRNPVVKYEMLTDGAGVVRITAVTSATVATAQVIRRLPVSVVDDPTYRWAEAAWSDLYGYPAAIELYQQRLIAASTPSEPRTLWFSAIGDFADFFPSIEADGAFAYAISGDSSVNAITWLRRGRSGLHIGALGEEYSSRAVGSDVLSATTASFGLDGTIGSADIRPLAPRGDPVFISKDRARIYETTYSLQSDANRPVELSLPAQHLGAEQFLEMAFQSQPQRLIWIRRGSGDLAVMVYDPDEQILGWATVPVAGGFVEALAVTSDAEGSADILTMIVRRELNGQTVRQVEDLTVTYGTLTGARPISEANHLFASVEFEPPEPQRSFSVPHLAGETVFAWSDLGNHGPLVADAQGNVELDDDVSRVIIGLFDDTHRVDTLPLQAQARDGHALGRLRRIHSTGVAVHRTAAGRVLALESDLARPQREGSGNDLLPLDVAAAITSGFTGVATVDATSGTGQQVALRFTPVGGAPMTITQIVPTVEEQGV